MTLRAWLIVQLAGIVGMAVGFGMLAVWVGVVVGSLGLVAFGVAGELAAGAPARADAAWLEEMRSGPRPAA